MYLLHEFGRGRDIDPRQRDLERYVEPEAPAILARADPDLGRHGAVVSNAQLPTPGDELDRAQEAGGIAAGKKLLGIGARAAELLRRWERKAERAVVDRGCAGSSTGGGGPCAIENVYHQLIRYGNNCYCNIYVSESPYLVESKFIAIMIVRCPHLTKEAR